MQLSVFTFGALWVLVVFLVVMVTGTPVCERTGQYIQDQDDCSVFYQCVRNVPVEKRCRPNLVFSQRASVCVWPNSIWNDCPQPQAQAQAQPQAQAQAQPQAQTNPPAPAPLQATSAPPTPPAPTERSVPAPQEDGPEPCSSVSSGLRLDSTSCSKYFNCSLRRTYIVPFLGFFSEECPYAQLFDAASMSCRPARQADCGTRPYSKDPCDWVENMCGGPHCRECASRLVDCTALRDGVQLYPGREDTPYYIECRDGWLVKVDQCPQDANGRYMRFSAQAGDCASMSSSRKGKCEGSRDIPLLLPHPDHCQLYLNCSAAPGGPLGDHVEECPYPQLFSTTRGHCLSFQLVDCGTRHAPKAPCEYRKMKCGDELCPGCDISYMSCEGMADGRNVFWGREGSPHYVICLQERTIGRGVCDVDNAGMFKVFSPKSRRCESIMGN